MLEKIQLSKPIFIGEDKINEIKMREPTVKDLNRLGLPFKFKEDGSFEAIASVISNYIAELADLPKSTVEQICMPDWVILMASVISFFMASPKTLKI